VRVHELSDALDAHLAAHAAVVEAAERRALVEMGRAVRVDEGEAGAQPVGDGRGPLRVLRPDRRAQARPRVVGAGDRVLDVVEGQDRHGRPELLLGDDPGVLGRVEDERGAHEVAPRDVGAVERLAELADLGARRARVLDQLLDVVALARAVQRAHRHALLEAVAEARRGKLGGQALDDLVVA
jgi:hypothetical protein